ncbi:hypothetical protein KAW38_03335 [Candidatus Micrarchaeota archaeon]|nr:hypothetical protein [Candidatus Micrarchaeota archaeon]
MDKYPYKPNKLANRSNGSPKNKAFSRKGPKTSEQSRQISARAKILIIKHKYQEAEKLLKETLLDHPSDVFFMNILIKVLGIRGKLLEAREIFDKAISRRITDKYTYNSMIDAYGKAGDVTNAKEIFDKAVSRRIADEYTYNSMIDAYGKAGDVTNAKEIFDEVVQKNIANVVTCNSMIDAYYRRDMFGEIISLIEKAPPHIQKNNNMFLNSCEALRKQKKYDLVISKIDDFLKVPKPYEIGNLAECIRAYCLKELGKNQEAVQLFCDLKNRLPESDVNYARVLCGLVFCNNVEELEKENFKEELLKCLNEGRGSARDIKAALGQLG